MKSRKIIVELIIIADMSRDRVMKLAITQG
jgi:hypothetical protein